MWRFDETNRERLIAEIYKAASDAVLWPMFLEHLASAFQATVIGMSVFPAPPQGRSPEGLESLTNVPAESFSYGLGMSEKSQKAYLADWVHHDDLTKIALKVCRETNRKILDRQEIASDTAFKRSDFYQNFVRYENYFHTIGALGFSKGRDAGYSLSINRPKQTGMFSVEEANWLDSLAPHLDCALEIHLKLSRLQTETILHRNALQSIGCGCFQVDRSLQITWMDAAGAALLQQNKVLTTWEGKLRVADESADHKLKEAVERVVQSELDAQSAVLPQVRVLLEVPSAFGPQALWVLPFTLPRLSVRRNSALVIVQNREDRRSSFELNLEYLKGRCHLTPAEYRVASLIVKGFTVQEISEKLHRSVGTIRYQLKQVLHKTGSRRQSELVAKVLAGGNPVRSSQSW
jgi:DNA-binding CsgD family transcriptional regulator